MNFSKPFISARVAEEFKKSLRGIPTENRILILSPKEFNRTKTGLFIPETTKEGIPRKGVVIQMGEITDEYKTYRELCQVGRIVTYGLYAGKELDLQDEDLPEALNNILENSNVTVLSMNEIIYSEPNLNI